MNTSILTVVLTGALLAGQNAAPTWQAEYGKAQQMSADQKKPLAVVFGSGADGWAKVVRESAPSAEVTRMLAEKYVCVYVDTASPAGKKLAQGFGITGNTGIVLGDRSGTVQAFWHQGDMTSQNLARYLQKYADPTVIVRGTETVATSARTSFYPSDSTWGATTTDPSYCPNCQGSSGRFRR